MTLHLYTPYIIGWGSNPITYQYENIATRLDSSSFEVTIFALPSHDGFEKSNMNTVTVTDSSKVLKRSKMAFTSLQNYDVLQTGGGPLLRYFTSKMTRARNPNLNHIHTLHLDIPKEDTREKRFKQRLVSMAETVVAVSNHTAQTAEREFGVTPTVIHNGIDAQYFRPGRRPPGFLDEQYRDEPVFLFVGRLESRKHPGDVLDVAQATPEASFLIRGEGPLFKQVQARASDLDNVTILNQLDKSMLADLYANVNALLFPSTREGCPTVVLEALASGTPVVGYQATSMPELVQDEVTGYLCDPGDTSALTDAVRALTDPDLNIEFGCRAREYAIANHRFETVAERYQKLYTKLQTNDTTGY